MRGVRYVAQRFVILDGWEWGCCKLGTEIVVVWMVVAGGNEGINFGRLLIQMLT